jgi:dTDP-4-dehydrorhamnose reductase
MPPILPTGSNFLLAMQKLAQTRNTIKVVDDQTGGPTWTRTIAQGTTKILEQCAKEGATRSNMISHSGIFNMSCGGETHWFGFVKKSLSFPA